jgi:hypothetical protein
MIPGVCIVAGIYAIVLMLLIVLRNKIFLNPLLSALSKIIFSDKQPDSNQNISPTN